MRRYSFIMLLFLSLTILCPQFSRANLFVENSSPPPEQPFSLLIQQAQYHLDKKELEEAFTAITAALRLNPYSSDAYLIRGHIFRAQGKLDQANADYTSAIRLNPDPANAYSWRGILYRQRSSYDLSIADLTTAISLQPQNYRYYHERGLTYYEQQRYQEALLDFDKVHTLTNQSVETYLYKGFTCLALDLKNRALEAFQSYLRLKQPEMPGGELAQRWIKELSNSNKR